MDDDLPISKDKWQSLIKSYDLKPLNIEEERQRLIELGRNSDLTNDDLFLLIPDETEKQLTDIFGRESVIQDFIDFQKGTIVSIALHLGISSKQAASMAKEGLGKMLDSDKGPSLDA